MFGRHSLTKSTIVRNIKRDDKFAQDQNTYSRKLTAVGCMDRHTDNSREEMLDLRYANEDYGMSAYYDDVRVLGKACDLIAQGRQLRQTKNHNHVERIESFIRRCV